MKTHIKIIFAIALMLFGITPKNASAQCPLPTQPVCFTITDGVNSLWSVKFNYSPTDPSYALQPGVAYNGWCLQFNAAIATDFEYCGATLRNLDGPLPAHLTEYSSPVVNQLNYIINNTGGASMLDVQFAMWNILQGFELTTQASIDLASNAVTIGSTFVPTATQKRAVILDLGPNSSIQRVIVEVSCGTPPPPPTDLCAQEAVRDTNINNNATYSFALGSILGNDFITGPQPLKLLQQPDGSLLLTGVVLRASNPNLCFNASVTLSGPTATAPAGYPQKYIAAASSAGWTYYTNVAGKLVGQKGLAGTNILIAASGAQFGFGANNNNLLNGFFSSFNWLPTDGTSTNVLGGSSIGSGVLAGQIIDCPDIDEACLNQATPVAGVSGGHAFYLPGIGTDFVAGSVPLKLVESSNGKASITGVVFSASNPCKGFIVDIALSGYTKVGPPGSPKLELPSTYYAPTGIVDTNSWHYYSNMVGTLTGIDCYAGGLLSITRMGPAPQFGIGANGKNTNDGASAWFTVTVVKSPTSGPVFCPTSHGDFNLDYAPCVDQEICAKEAYPALVSGGHALYLPGIGTDFVASGKPLKFTEYEDGTAFISGNVYSKADTNKGFAVSIQLSGLVEPPAPAPSGSPKIELPASAYLPTGPVDTNKWRYYTSFNGTLTGIGTFAGGSLSITRMGPAFQAGYGANGKNTNDGASAWFTFTVTKSPSCGIYFKSGSGDLNLDIIPCDFTPPPPPVCVGTGTPGYWKNHPEAWPVTTIVVGGVNYTRTQAITAMGTSPAGDNTYTMFRHLVSAKLNVLIGNVSTCVSATIASADQWLVANPLGSGVSGGSAAWTAGAPLATALDDYNNGRLCAPHRDNLTCDSNTCPTAPTDLKLVVNVQGKVVVSWSDNSATETGFYIERKTGTYGTWTKIGQVAKDVSTYTDTNSLACSTYCYRVRTANCPEYSGDCCITITPPCPNPPTGLVLVSNLCTKVIIKWTDNSSNETCFIVERKTGTTGTWSQIGKVSANCTSFTDLCVKDGVTYLYRVRTCDCADYTNELTVNVPTCPPPTVCGDGLQGCYYNSKDLTCFKFSRIDGTVNFDWGTGSPSSSLPCDRFSVRWTGQIQAEYSQTYTFYVTGDDGVRLWVNGVKIIDGWCDQAPKEYSGTIALVAGRKYDIKLEYYENSGGAVCKLAWSSASVAKQIVPKCNLFSGGYTGYCQVSVPWQHKDVGGCSLPGDAKDCGSGSISISCSGDDIWGSYDKCRFLYQNASGDCEIKAKICGIGDSDAWAKCGVMIRESLNGNSSHAFMCLTSGNGLAFQRRCGTGYSSEHTPGGNTGDCWVKLVRRGNTFTSYKSKDGTTWTQVGACNIPMGSNCYIGIAATSHNDSKLNDCKVSNISIRQ